MLIEYECPMCHRPVVADNEKEKVYMLECRHHVNPSYFMRVKKVKKVAHPVWDVGVGGGGGGSTLWTTDPGNTLQSTHPISTGGSAPVPWHDEPVYPHPSHAAPIHHTSPDYFYEGPMEDDEGPWETNEVEPSDEELGFVEGPHDGAATTGTGMAQNFANQIDQEVIDDIIAVNTVLAEQPVPMPASGFENLIEDEEFIE